MSTRREPHPAIRPLLDLLTDEYLNTDPAAIAACQRLSRLLKGAAE